MTDSADRTLGTVNDFTFFRCILTMLIEAGMCCWERCCVQPPGKHWDYTDLAVGLSSPMLLGDCAGELHTFKRYVIIYLPQLVMTYMRKGHFTTNPDETLGFPVKTILPCTGGASWALL